LDAVKTEYPHLIECPKEDFKDKLDSDLPPPPPSPDTIDKENVVMTEILPHIFVGMYFFFFFKSSDVEKKGIN
jgi:hypothetical protein